MLNEKSTAQKYPRSVGFIVSSEFCERFNYYGMRTILVLYLTNKLGYDTDTATVLFHIFSMLVYFFPLVGAIIADSWLGKFKTILYLSIVYTIGGIIITLGAIPVIHLPVKAATIVGLLLIALGTGGIKPCVSAFGGDQFRLPEQAKQLATFFSLFYFAINAGSTISTTITPIMRADVHCFGDKDCFSLAFGVPAVLMLISVLILVAGKRLYVLKPPAGNMIFSVSKCISEAIKGRRKERGNHPHKHWLDYAEPVCGSKLVNDTKILFKILVLYLPFPVFWALFDQQGSRWTFQATRMNGYALGFDIKPDQMQVINPMLILTFIPLFDYVIYPVLSKLGIRRPLQKLTVGGLLAATAFVLSALVELKIEAHEPALPADNEVLLRLYNGMPCSYEFMTNLPGDQQNFRMNEISIFEQKYQTLAGSTTFTYNATSTNSLCTNLVGEFELVPAKAVGYFIENGRMQRFEDIFQRPPLGDAQIRIILNTPENAIFTLTDSANVVNKLVPLNVQQIINLPRGEVTLTVNGKILENLTVNSGGLYVLLVNGNNFNEFTTYYHTLIEPNSVHMFWQLPQIIVITAAEIMFSVTGLEFSFTQAPESMKSVLQACWLLSVAIGNMLVVVIAELKFFKSQAAEFMLFVALMVVDMLIFALLAKRYKYVNDNDVSDEESAMESPTKSIAKGITQEDTKGAKSGHANDAYLDE